MSDLISRENAKDMFCEHCDERVLFGLDVDVCREKCRCGLMRMLDKVKTVDAVPVVRCKDCKYFGGRNDKPDEATAIGYCENPRHFIMPCRYDFFCADGVRKEQSDEID